MMTAVAIAPRMYSNIMDKPSQIVACAKVKRGYGKSRDTNCNIDHVKEKDGHWIILLLYRRPPEEYQKFCARIFNREHIPRPGLSQSRWRQVCRFATRDKLGKTAQAQILRAEYKCEPAQTHTAYKFHKNEFAKRTNAGSAKIRRDIPLRQGLVMPVSTLALICTGRKDGNEAK